MFGDRLFVSLVNSDDQFSSFRYSMYLLQLWCYRYVSCVTGLVLQICVMCNNVSLLCGVTIVSLFYNMYYSVTHDNYMSCNCHVLHCNCCGFV